MTLIKTLKQRTTSLDRESPRFVELIHRVWLVVEGKDKTRETVCKLVLIL